MQGILRKDLIHEERGKRNLKLEYYVKVVTTSYTQDNWTRQ